MALTQADDIADLVKGTLVDLGRLKWTLIATNYQKYVFGSHMLHKEKVGFESGRDIQFNLQVAQSLAARMVALGQQDVVNIVDTMQTAVIPWRHSTTSWAVVRQTLKMNREPAKIFDLLKEYRAASMVSMADLLETQGWNTPNSSSDNLNVLGLPHWLVPNTTQGFNGLNPFGFSAGCGGLSSVTYPNWANYTDSYGNVTKQDFVRRWRRASDFCEFEAPVGVDHSSYETGGGYGYYCTYYVKGLAEEILEQQNDNLGHDIASMDGKVMFRRTPLTWVPRLETLSGTGGMSTGFSNSTYTSQGGYPLNPLFGICWKVMRPIFLKGEYMLEHGPVPVPFQHTALQTFLDLTWNVICHDRRLNFVLTQ